MPRFRILALFVLAGASVPAARSISNAKLVTAEECQERGAEVVGAHCAAYLLQAHARVKQREDPLEALNRESPELEPKPKKTWVPKPKKRSKPTTTTTPKRRKSKTTTTKKPSKKPRATTTRAPSTIPPSAQAPVVCPGSGCTLESCCPKSKSDCIQTATRVKEIFKYILASGTGSACTTYVEDTESETVTADDLCVSSKLVLGTQAIVDGDPGNCLETMYTPTTLAPQLGCNPWARFSDSTGVLAFLKALYQQSSFDDGAGAVSSIMAAVGAYARPLQSSGYPMKWARFRIFDKSLDEGVQVPKLMFPNPAALVVGPAVDAITYAAGRGATDTATPPAMERGGPARAWWKGSEFLLLNCGRSVGKTQTCTDARRVLESLSLAASQTLQTENYMEITGCPWTRPAQAVPGMEAFGPQKNDPFDFFANTGTYSCTGGLHEAWTCLNCPKDSRCIGPDAKKVSKGWEGCGMEEAQRCYPVQWFGKAGAFPTDGCSDSWQEDMTLWLANPREHLRELAEKDPGQITAVEAVNTLMFVFDVLFSSSHSGSAGALGGFVNTDGDGNPTCSTTGVMKSAMGTPVGKECGTGDNLPCCSPTATTGDTYVQFASPGAASLEYIAVNVKSPSDLFPCIATIEVCGPDGSGPTVTLSNGSSVTLKCGSPAD